MVDLLLRFGAKPHFINRIDTCNSILHYAVKDKQTAILERLTPFFESLTKFNEQGFTPLYFAVIYDQPEMITCLLAHQVEIDAKADFMPPSYTYPDKKYFGYTPLHLAIALKRKQAAEILLSHGANVDTHSYPFFREIWSQYKSTITLIEDAQHDSNFLRLLISYRPDWKELKRIGYSLEFLHNLLF